MSGTQPISRTAFETLVEQKLPDNTTASITPSDVRTVFGELAVSTLWHDEAASGASAYDVAVSAGFSGDVAAWLDSLIGPAGPMGPQGGPGQQGPAGPKGDDGRTVATVRNVSDSRVMVQATDDGVAFATATETPTDIVLPDETNATTRLGFVVHIIQLGAGVGRFVTEGTAKLKIMEPFLPETRGSFAAISAVKIAPDTWRVHGDAAFAPGTLFCTNGGAHSGVLSEAGTDIRLGVDHVGMMVETTASEPVTVRVSVDSAIKVGTVIHLVQAGAGAVHLVADAGAKLLHCGSRLPEGSGLNGVIVLHKTAEDTWRASGDLALVRAFS